MARMMSDLWPIFALRVVTSRIELRIPDLDELALLGEVAGRGLYEPGSTEQIVPWMLLPPAERARAVPAQVWRRLGTFEPMSWRLPLGVFADGVPVGFQFLSGDRFAVRREIATGSWLGLSYQGLGIGTQMRAAALELAFTGLGAVACTSEAFVDNAKSLAVSKKFGYEADGITRHAVGSEVFTEQRLRLTRERWQRRALRVPVRIEGLEPCLVLMGASS
jgi:RimJ/RimL family protein N-acetyltransferase